MRTVAFSLAATALVLSHAAPGQEPTYAERLGWPAGTRAVIFHNDDAGMSHSSNRGIIESHEKGLATSVSIMMPCPWVPEFTRYVEENPDTDYGLHLTHTSEWDDYRWGPVAGRGAVPGLVDPEGYLWGSVEDVVEHAGADEVEREMRAQVDMALGMGLKPTHLDSHMGTVFARPDFLEGYIRVGIDTGIPVLIAAGHLTHAAKGHPDAAALVRESAARVWDAGLPVIDDIFADTYGWKTTGKTAHYAQLLRGLKPGITEIILHCTRPSDVFPAITTSSDTRLGDLNAMLSPELRRVVEEEGIVLTTWRELHRRRSALD